MEVVEWCRFAFDIWNGASDKVHTTSYLAPYVRPGPGSAASHVNPPDT